EFRRVLFRSLFQARIVDDGRDVPGARWSCAGSGLGESDRRTHMKDPCNYRSENDDTLPHDPMTLRILRNGMPDLPPALFEIEFLVRRTLFVVAGSALLLDRRLILVFRHARGDRLRLVLHHAHGLVSRSGAVADLAL